MKLLQNPEEECENSTIGIWGQRFILVIVLVWGASFFIGFQNSLTILAIIGFITAILGWRSPSIALLGLGMIAALDSMVRVFLLSGGLLRWNTFNYWMLLVILLSIPFMLRLRDPHSRFLQVFIFLLLLGLLISPRKTFGIQDIVSILSLFGMYVYFARVVKVESNIHWLGLVIGILTAVGNLAYFLQKQNLPYINPNAQANFPLTGLFAILLTYPAARCHHRSRLLLLLLAAVNMVWIFLSGSRGNMLVGIFCFLFLFLLTRSMTWGTLFLSLGIFTALYLTSTFVDDQLYARQRIEKLFDTSFTLAQRTSGRSDLALEGWRIFLENPLGVGTGGFRYYAGRSEILEFHEKPAHSAWIKTLSENGILGFLILFGYLTSFTIVGLRKKEQDLQLLGIFVTIAFATTYLSTEFQGKALWFLAAGATVLLHKEEFIQNIQIGGKLKKYQRWRLRNYDRWTRNNDVKYS
jgi:hypothetical protein